jgi:thiol-disulfide isomerase/thioredoxin
LLAHAAGAATSLALALMVGGRLFAAMKRSLGAGEWIRRGLGAAVLAAVVAIFFGVDTGFFTQVSLANTASLEQSLVDRIHPAAAASVVMNGDAVMSGNPSMRISASAPTMAMTANPVATMKATRVPAPQALPIEGSLPSLSGAVEWLNSPPLAPEQLKGKVALIDFWTYSCVNCLRSIPYVRAWAEKYRDRGLVVIGVHAPEFPFENKVDNVRQAVARLKINYPVATDNDYAIWRAFDNEYWPADYFIDAQGRIRHHFFGEGDYAESEKAIQQLLAESGRESAATGLVSSERRRRRGRAGRS